MKDTDEKEKTQLPLPLLVLKSNIEIGHFKFSCDGDTEFLTLTCTLRLLVKDLKNYIEKVHVNKKFDLICV